MIGWYVHHHGGGHSARAVAVAAHLTLPVTGYSTREKPTGWSGRWVRLPDDADVDVPERADVTAGSTLHWVPRHHSGLRARMAVLSTAVGRKDLHLMVVDVSVEVTVLARLFGVPVVVMAQPGDRTDRAHRLAYDMADLILAPWPSHPARHWPAEWMAKTEHLGGISRYDGWSTCAAGPQPRPTVLVMWGAGGIDVERRRLAEAAEATPGWSWLVAGPTAERAAPGPDNLHDLGWVPDMWPHLNRTDVVVTHGGQNAVAEVAAARRPAVIIPQNRPFGEQVATAEAIRRGRFAAVARTWPAAGDWPALLDSAVGIGGDGWSRWSSGHGALRAARRIEELCTEEAR